MRLDLPSNINSSPRLNLKDTLMFHEKEDRMLELKLSCRNYLGFPPSETMLNLLTEKCDITK